jgi:magnesium transporter
MMLCSYLGEATVSKLIKKISKKAGLPPGTLVHVGEKKTEKVKITIIDYDKTQFQEKVAESFEECVSFKETPTVTWINVDGIHDVEIIENLGKCFDLHPLLLEDVLNTEHRPKLEDFDSHLFFVLKTLISNEDGNIKYEQFSIVLGGNYVISFQETPGDVFDSIRDRIRKGKGRVRNKGPDYLAYALIDSIVDSYFSILEKLGDKIEGIEGDLINEPTPETLQAIHRSKRDLIFMRKSVWPLREVVRGLQRGESKLIKKGTEKYLRDVYDHTIQVIDTIETFRDMLSGMLDIYLSSVSNKMNEVMKVLTIIATIFIPITFVAGIYGMNFEYMPELGWKYGYFTVWLVIITVMALMIVYFKRKKWL